MCSPSSNDFHNSFFEHFFCTFLYISVKKSPFCPKKVKLQEFEGLLERVRPFKKDEAVASANTTEKGKRIRKGHRKRIGLLGQLDTTC